MSLELTIAYTDGQIVCGTVDDWQQMRADGVDAIRIGDKVFNGHALYWLYRGEDGVWAFGMASTYVSPPPPETLFRTDGSVIQRPLVTIPDLMHRWVKLGWWKRPAPGGSYTCPL